MSTLSIHPIDYFRHHVHFEGVWRRGITPLVKKVFEASERAAAITVVLLTVGLIIISCMIIVQSALLAASYDAAITEIVVSPIQVLPIGMHSFSILLL